MKRFQAKRGRSKQTRERVHRGQFTFAFPNSEFRIPKSKFIFHLFSFLFLLSSFILLLPPFSLASAQTSAYVEIGIPDVADFPTISAALDVYDANGHFVSGLRAKDVMAVEDGNPRPVQKLTEFPVGAQIVVGINPGPALAVRDGNGVTRYEKAQQALTVWSQALQPEDGDDLSLVTFSGPIIAHTDPASWLASLASFQPNFRATTPNIQSLTLAVEVAGATVPQVGMKRAVLFITPHMDDLGLEATLAEIAQRAAAARVRIFVWYVDGEPNFTHPSAGFFQALATQTGGSFVAFDGRGELPDPETYFSPLRKAYTLTYESALNRAGDHTLVAEVALGETRIASLPQTFALNVQPPNPIFSAPPTQITRQPPADDPYNGEILLPTEQPLEVIFDFPDGYPRPITRVVLYVDGQPVAENTTG
ncbi:MAG: hypothetical protein AB1750_08930, partial [Chloroflexota bacterium]